MKHILRVLSATAALVLLSSAAHAVVVVQAFTQEIQDIGEKTGYGDIVAGQPVPDDQITAFQDGIGAHEVTGHLVFTAREGQWGGDTTGFAAGIPLCGGVAPFRAAQFDNGDWDIPDRLFGCQDLVGDGTGCFPGPLTGVGVSIDNRDTNLFFDSSQECDIAPDITGRLDSPYCSDLWVSDGVGGVMLNATPTFACAIPPSRSDSYAFFNYMACFPTIDCFQPNPALDSGTCDMGGAGPFADQIALASPEDIWIAGTLMKIRLPMGTRVGNTVYPGTMLNGEGQYGYNDPLSARMGNLGWGDTLSADIAWPAVIHDFEANHVVPLDGSTPTCTPSEPSTFNITWSPALCQAGDEQYDKLTIFVPDILVETSTSPQNQQAVFQIGEALIDQAGLMPADRDLVANCYRDNVTCLGLGMDPCDYDTRLCLDIRGAYMSMRPVYSDPLRRYVVVNPELPQDSPVDLSPPSNWQIGILKSRVLTDLDPGFVPNPESFPSCDGYNSCFVIDDGVLPLAYDPLTDELYPMAGTDDKFLYVASTTSTITITEPATGFVRVDPNWPTNPMLRSTLTCELAGYSSGGEDSRGNNASDGIDFVYVNQAMTNQLLTPQGVCPIVAPPTASPLGTLSVTTSGGMLGAFPIDGGLAPAGPPIGGEIDIQGGDQFMFHITQESSTAASTIVISGFELMIRNDSPALPGGIGCIEVDCTLYFPGDECELHEGVANDDVPVPEHRPTGGGLYGPFNGFFDNMPIACIVPGRTTLLYPYMVKALGYDTGIVVTNTMGSDAIVHFYLYQEEGPIDEANPASGNVGLNPSLAILKAYDPETLAKNNSPCIDATTPCPRTYYDAYNEIPAFGQYVNMVFAIENDPLVPKNDWSALQGLSPSTGIFSSSTLANLTSDPDGNPATDDGRVWMYAVVQQCYSHGYQMVFSDGGFGSTLALVDNETNITPVDGKLNRVLRSAASYFVPFHNAPIRYISTTDMAVPSYDYWTGNDE